MTTAELRSLFDTELSDYFTRREVQRLLSILTESRFGRTPVGMRYAENLDSADVQYFKDIIQELKAGKPYQQLLGETQFYGMRFFVNEDVLIPRPETEELLELALLTLKKREITDPRILDIGTGSGVIPVVLKKHLPEAQVTAIDISENALATARKNAELHETAVFFKQCDYLSTALRGVYDVLISNPPYIGKDETGDIHTSVKDFEPYLALFSPTDDPLIFYRKIARDAADTLSDSGMVFLEINQKYGPQTLTLFNGFREKQLLKDLSGNDRFIFAVK